MGFLWWRKDKPKGISSAHRARLADKDVRKAVDGYRRFRHHFEADRAFYGRLSASQEPNLLWIGCSDSRVVPNIITNADPGSLFVVRNIANIVPPAGSGDSSVGAAIEYAVLHLGIDDIVVCGHTNCGGVKAIQEGLPGPEVHLHSWVRHSSVPKQMSALEATKRNIRAQRDNLLTYDVVRERAEKGALNVHEWLYDMDEGEILAYDAETDRWRHLAGGD
ncbi:MAG: carbonic anhydrase [Hyphomicrobiaceae bacterium]